MIIAIKTISIMKHKFFTLSVEIFFMVFMVGNKWGLGGVGRVIF